ncbi:hypothetical protein M1E17_18085 [Arthrobacter sp. D1-29]
MEDVQLAAQTLMREQEMDPWELWVVFWGHGGNLDALSFEAFIQGLMPGDNHDLETLRWTLKDLRIQ